MTKSDTYSQRLSPHTTLEDGSLSVENDLMFKMHVHIAVNEVPITFQASPAKLLRPVNQS